MRLHTVQPHKSKHSWWHGELAGHAGHDGPPAAAAEGMGLGCRVTVVRTSGRAAKDSASSVMDAWTGRLVFCPPQEPRRASAAGEQGFGDAKGLLRGHGEDEADDALPEGRAVEGIHTDAGGSIETGLSPSPQVRHLAQERRRRHLQGRCRRSQRWSGKRGEDERASPPGVDPVERRALAEDQVDQGGRASRVCPLPSPLPPLFLVCMCRSARRGRSSTAAKAACELRRYLLPGNDVPSGAVVLIRSYAALAGGAPGSQAGAKEPAKA
jgi:hypothetical protein